MWHCLTCKEEVDDEFDACWNCGAPPPHELQGLEKPPTRGVSPFACPKCHAMKVIPEVLVVYHPEKYVRKELTVVIERDPNAWFDKGTESAELRANICGQCGFTELFATNPAGLWNAFQDRLPGPK